MGTYGMEIYRKISQKIWKSLNFEKQTTIQLKNPGGKSEQKFPLKIICCAALPSQSSGILKQ